MLVSSALSGRNPSTGVLPETVAEQAETALDNVERVCAAAGGTIRDVVKVTVFAGDRAAVRAALDPFWIRLFPHEDDRPVRHTLTTQLPDGFHLQIEFIAVMEDDRT